MLPQLVAAVPASATGDEPRSSPARLGFPSRRTRADYRRTPARGGKRGRTASKTAVAAIAQFAGNFSEAGLYAICEDGHAGGAGRVVRGFNSPGCVGGEPSGSVGRNNRSGAGAEARSAARGAGRTRSPPRSRAGSAASALIDSHDAVFRQHGAPVLDLRGRRGGRLPTRARDPAHEGAADRRATPWSAGCRRSPSGRRWRSAASGSGCWARRERPVPRRGGRARSRSSSVASESPGPNDQTWLGRERVARSGEALRGAQAAGGAGADPEGAGVLVRRDRGDHGVVVYEREMRFESSHGFPLLWLLFETRIWGQRRADPITPLEKLKLSRP